MSKMVRALLNIGLALGLLFVALHGEAKPPAPPPTTPTCPTCPIVYVQTTTSQNRSDLMLMQADGSQKTVLLSGAKGVRHGNPSWAPDGDWIAFTSNQGGVHRLWFVRRDGAYPTPVLTPCGSASSLAWRPVPAAATGKHWLAYSANCGAWDLWAVEVDLDTVPPEVSSGPFCLTCNESSGAYDWGEPAWTGDGTHLTAVRGESPYVYSYVMFDFDANTSTLENGRTIELPGLGNAYVNGDWAHSTNRLAAAVHSFDLGTDDLWWFDFDRDAGTITDSGCLTGFDDEFAYESVQWSPGGTQLLFWARSVELGGGYFVSPLTGFARPAMPILSNTRNTMFRGADWKPNPDPEP